MTGVHLLAVIILVTVSCLLIATMIGMIGVIIFIPNTKRYFANINREVGYSTEMSDNFTEGIISESGYGCSVIYRLVKRTFDVIISLTGLTIYFPFMLIIAIFLRLGNKEKAIFRKRKIVGYKGKEIYVYSFQCPKKRNSALYSILHKTGLYNLPMFFNVLKGNLSLVGLSMRDNFDNKSRIRIYDYEKPGMVCLANIFNAQGDMDTFLWDLLYLEKRNIRMDVGIVFGGIMMPTDSYLRKKHLSGNENTLDIRYAGNRMEANADTLEKNESAKNVALICPNCLQELPNGLSKGLVFCPYCGNKVGPVKQDTVKN
ncbi:MAG: sugar transferase [Lachnospiraceae bacterium]|nr:sugar transferase [Lachnospiraceae bacterium]